MMKIRLSMNGESPMMASVSGSRSGAPGSPSTARPTMTTEHAVEREAQPSRLVASRPHRRASWCGLVRAPQPPRGGSAEPRLDDRSVTTVTTRAMKNVETIENQRFAVTVSGSVPGSTSPIASFVISVRRLSIGVIRTLTAKTALTPA